MPQARIDDLCDAVVTTLAGAWQAGGPTAPNSVTAEFGPDVGLTPDEPDSLVTGRKVFVFPGAYAAPDMLDRDDIRKTYTVSVLIVERYTDAAGSPPLAWMRARTLFVEQVIFKTLRSPRLLLLGTLIPDPETPGTVDVVYDLDVFIEHRAFWSQASFTFTEGEEFNT